MKRMTRTSMAAFVFIVISMVVPIYAGISAVSILRQGDKAEGYHSLFTEGYQLITTTSGATRKLVARSWAVNNGEKQLSEYLYPSDIKGQKILMTAYGDNIWMYNPETRRTRKLGSHMRKRKVMGSDFTYEDQAGGRMSEKYRGTFLRMEEEGGTECYVLELKPTKKGPSYGKVIAWFGKKDYVTRRVDYYAKGEGKPFKRLIMENIKPVGSKKVPMKMTMTNLEDKTKTVSVTTKIRFGVKLPDSIFQSRNLSR
jgi:outer membrane lipoprotein-sorting protein